MTRHTHTHTKPHALHTCSRRLGHNVDKASTDSRLVTWDVFSHTHKHTSLIYRLAQKCCLLLAALLCVNSWNSHNFEFPADTTQHNVNGQVSKDKHIFYRNFGQKGGSENGCQNNKNFRLTAPKHDNLFCSLHSTLYNSDNNNNIGCSTTTLNGNKSIIYSPTDVLTAIFLHLKVTCRRTPFVCLLHHVYPHTSTCVCVGVCIHTHAMLKVINTLLVRQLDTLNVTLMSSFVADSVVRYIYIHIYIYIWQSLNSFRVSSELPPTHPAFTKPEGNGRHSIMVLPCATSCR